MSAGENLVTIMDEAARRVLSGAERPYDVAAETCRKLVFLPEGVLSAAGWSAYVIWAELTDIVEILDAPEPERLCDELAVAFSRGWLALADRENETEQADFVSAFDIFFDKRLDEYRAQR